MQDITRRSAIVGPVAFVLPTPIFAADCRPLLAQIDRVEADLGSVDAWVQVEGPALISSLRSQIVAVRTQLATTTAQWTQAERVLIIDALSVGTGVALMIAGVVVTPTAVIAGVMFLIGFGVSTTLLLAKLAVAPEDIQAMDIVEMRTAENLQNLCEAWEGDPVVVAGKATASLAKHIIGFFALYRDMLDLVKSAADANVLEGKRLEIEKHLLDLESDLTSLDQPGNLYAYRLEQLTFLKARLEANLIDCNLSPPP